eukprot:15225614-Alexandrium_andersonii.AAC.1
MAPELEARSDTWGRAITAPASWQHSLPPHWGAYCPPDSPDWRLRRSGGGGWEGSAQRCPSPPPVGPLAPE